MAAPGQRHQRGELLRRQNAWVLRYRVDVPIPDSHRIRRARTSITIGTVQELRTRTAARAVADQIMDSITGRNIAPGTAISATKYLARYQAERVVLLRPTSQRLIRSRILHHIGPHVIGLRLDQVTAGVAQKLVSKLTIAGLGTSSTRQVVKLLRTILRAALDDGYAVHPFEMRSIRFASQVKALPRRKVFTGEELVQLLEAVPFPWRAAYAVSASLGLRCGETLGLDWADVDLAAGSVRIRQAAVDGRLQALKTARSTATLALSGALVQILTEYRDARGGSPTGLLFASRTGRPLHSSAYRRALAKHLKRAGLEHRGTHAFRHSAASLLLAQGLSPAAVRDSLRHHDMKQTDTYSHAVSSDLRRGAEMLGSLITTPRASR
jgi:integrase